MKTESDKEEGEMEEALKKKRETAEVMEVWSQFLPMACLLAYIVAPAEITDKIIAMPWLFNLLAFLLGLVFLVQGAAEGWCSMLFLKGDPGVSYQKERSRAVIITVLCMSAMLVLVLALYWFSEKFQHSSYLFGLVFFAVAFNLGRPFWMVFWMKRQCPELIKRAEANHE